MKKILFLAIFACLPAFISPLGVQAQNRSRQHGNVEVQGAEILFRNMTCDLGEVSRKSKDLVHEFRFVNDGTTPLVILSATTSCSCIKTDYSRKPIAPGDEGTIKMTLESRKMEPGVFHRVIQVRSNAVSGVKLLTVQGNSVE